MDTKKVKELPPRIHIKEFMASTDLTNIQKAGFQSFVNGKVWMRKAEWQSVLEKYKKREVLSNGRK